MKGLKIGLALLALTAVASAHPQGFMNQIRNFFRPNQQPNRFRRPPPPPPPPRQPQQFQPQPFQPQPQPQQFQPQPPQPQQFQPQPNSFQSQPQFNNPAPPPPPPPPSFQSQPPAPSPSVRFASNNNNNGNNANSFNNGNNGNNFNNGNSGNSPGRPNHPQNFNRCAQTERPNFCPQAPPNHVYKGKNYLLTWNISCTNCECSKFTQDEAQEYCASMGANPVSLDTPDKINEFLGVSARYALRYYWTGARIQYPSEVIQWPNGVNQPIRNHGQHPWSNTGGWKNQDGSTHVQPDNRNQLRDNCEPEFCIGVLNNFYADGIKFHDVACHHRKPTICEWP